MTDDTQDIMKVVDWLSVGSKISAISLIAIITLWSVFSSISAFALQADIIFSIGVIGLILSTMVQFIFFVVAEEWEITKTRSIVLPLFTTVFLIITVVTIPFGSQSVGGATLFIAYGAFELYMSDVLALMFMLFAYMIVMEVSRVSIQRHFA